MAVLGVGGAKFVENRFEAVGVAVSKSSERHLFYGLEFSGEAARALVFWTGADGWVFFVSFFFGVFLLSQYFRCSAASVFLVFLFFVTLFWGFAA